MIPFKNRYLKEKFTFTTTKRTKASKFHFLLILCFIFVIFFHFSSMTHSLISMDISGNIFQFLPLKSLRNIHSLTRLIAQR